MTNAGEQFRRKRRATYLRDQQARKTYTRPSHTQSETGEVMPTDQLLAVHWMPKASGFTPQPHGGRASSRPPCVLMEVPSSNLGFEIEKARELV